MSTKDFIKKSVLNTFTQYDAPKLALALLTALALGILIYLVYRQFIPALYIPAALLSRWLACVC